MAKQIIILGRPDNNRFTVAYWLQVPVARRPFYANTDAVSQYKNIDSQELTDLKAGVFVEQVEEHGYGEGMTIGQIQASLIQEFNRKQTAVSNKNSWNRYGTFYDGASWTAGGVA